MENPFRFRNRHPTWESQKAVYQDETDENGRVLFVNQPEPEPEPALDGTVQQPFVVPRSLLEEIELGLEYMGGAYRREISAKERMIFADLLGKLLRYEPEKRMSAKMALDHEWFKL